MKRIMLVDDDHISNFIMKIMIEKFSKESQVETYTNPVKTFQNLPIQNPDIIFLDLNMPETDGITF
jgi:two-component SAPR family response regulator